MQVAVAAFSEFLMAHEMQIYLVVFTKESVQLSKKLVQNVRSYIDEHYIAQYEKETYSNRASRERSERYRISRSIEMREACEAAPSSTGVLRADDLDSFLQKKDAGFVETLLDLIQKSGQKNSAIYKKANISKQHFSKLINDPNAKPSKPTAIALALALGLCLEDTKDLLGRAGYALTNSSKFDLIIRYFIEQGNYNVVEIIIALYEFDQPLLGS